MIAWIVSKEGIADSKLIFGSHVAAMLVFFLHEIGTLKCAKYVLLWLYSLEKKILRHQQIM